MKKSKCEICGNWYKTYPIIIDNNPLSITSLFEEETKPDGTKRAICEECRDKLDKRKTPLDCEHATRNEWGPAIDCDHPKAIKINNCRCDTERCPKTLEEKHD